MKKLIYILVVLFFLPLINKAQTTDVLNKVAEQAAENTVKRVSLPNCKSQFVADLPSDDAIIFQAKKYLITVNELNLSSQSNFIKNIVSSNMLNYDCVLSDQNSDADYIISITANITQDRKLYGIYFCNADVVLKITDKKTHIPVYQNTYTKYKCGSNISFQDAADNTFKDVADKISADILTFLAF